MSKNNTPSLYYIGFLLIFLLVFSLVCIYFPLDATFLTGNLFHLYILGINLLLLFDYKLPNKKAIGNAMLLTYLVALTEIDRHLIWEFYRFNWWSLMPILLTFLASLNFFRLKEVYPESDLVFISHGKNKAWLISVLIGILCGLLGAGINFIIKIKYLAPTPNWSIHALILSLDSAIFEEIALRTSFYTLALHLFKGNLTNKYANYLTWIGMILPFAIDRQTNVFMSEGLVAGVISSLILSLVFYFIFAFLQRKRDILSAMVAHGLVSAIYYMFFQVNF